MGHKFPSFTISSFFLEDFIGFFLVQIPIKTKILDD